MTIGWVIWGFLALEVFLRAALEIAEIRKSGQKNDRFALVRIIPLLNDLLPPESLSSKPQAPESAFAKAHERAHQKFHHGIIRQFFWAGILIAIAVFLGSVGILFQLGLVELLLLFHLLFAVFVSRIMLHNAHVHVESARNKLVINNVFHNVIFFLLTEVRSSAAKSHIAEIVFKR